MRARADIHNEFVARFHFGNRPPSVTDLQIDVIEAELDCKLPNAFREFLTQYGAVYTPIILDEISEKGIDHPDVQDFLGPRAAIDATKGDWAAGMPSNVIGIASDCMGNMIGFWRQHEISDDAPVVFFDHDFVDVKELAHSFDEFLSWYLNHLSGQQKTAN
ncbi:MAG: SMI1/KNR4 family protein [Planctomycetia bacterium]|nr:SMI1/KNR4 family protein [Planctomycetia bacterium]